MTQLPFRLESGSRLLVLRLPETHDTLGWSINRPGFAETREIVWLEVRDRELPIGLDPIVFLRGKLSSLGIDESAVAFMTSRDIRRRHVSHAEVGRVTATCLTTVGLSNGERVGARRPEKPQGWGTINTLVHLSRPLSNGAFVEAISIATQARTVAILEAQNRPSEASVTGTGTDCIVVAAPRGDEVEHCAGLHTDIGEAIGRAVYDATFEGVRTWSADIVDIRSGAYP
jgi:adenosylcobinamide amidohydrolase